MARAEPNDQNHVKDDQHDDLSRWALLSNHGHVLLYLAQQPEARLRDIAQQVGITERAAQRIVSDLETSGLLTRVRDPQDGRRNCYTLHLKQPLRHPAETEYSADALLALIAAPQPGAD